MEPKDHFVGPDHKLKSIVTQYKSKMYKLNSI